MLAAVVQMTSTPDVDANLESAALGISEAAERGAELICLPECFASLREETETAPDPLAAELAQHRAVQFLREQARAQRVWLAGGTVPELASDGRVHNTAVLLDPDGALVAHYRKIHLFDVDVPGASLQESRSVAPGEKVVTAATPLGHIGLSVCYDVRFPELYRALIDQGAQILLVPAAFTQPTGRDHWEVLLRARAIESQAYVLAAAQFGEHNRTRRSYGRSMIIDPWGTVLAQVPDGGRVGLAPIDLQALAQLRRRLPCLTHRRL